MTPTHIVRLGGKKVILARDLPWKEITQGRKVRTPKDFLKLRQLSVHGKFYGLINSISTNKKILDFTFRARAFTLYHNTNSQHSLDSIRYSNYGM